MKNLNEKQKTIISDLIEEFSKINSTKKKKETTNFIDIIANKGFEYQDAKELFYENIAEDNRDIKIVSKIAQTNLGNTLSALFSKYEIAVNVRDTSITLNNPIIKKGYAEGELYLIISMFYPLCVNKNGGHYFHFENDSKNEGMSKLASFEFIIGSAAINTKNLEKCPVFIDRITEMFKKFKIELKES